MSVNFESVLNFIRSKDKNINFKLNSQDDLKTEISDVISDSREVKSGTLFCCIKGEKSDGHEYAKIAENSGACAFLCEREIDSNLPQIVVKNVREFLGEVSALVYGNPSDKLLMVGVTGTNGKTTTTYITRSILQASGIRVGLLGTIIESDGIIDKDADRTTPESSIVQRQLASMVKNNCKACVMETSSHGLYFGRIKGALYDVPVFTNLYPEHLDFHVTMENYFEAKKLLFTNYTKPNFIGAANSDDPYGKRLLDEFSKNLRGFGLKNVIKSNTTLNGTELVIHNEGFSDVILHSPLVGDFNIMNTLCAVTAMRGRVDDDAIIEGVKNVPQVPGRLERIDLPNGACVFVDFAHTPSALKSVLRVIRKLSGNDRKIISVFGHGGGRYQQNRPELAKSASEFADEIIITSDNARDEDPMKIAEAIASGATIPNKIILDRAEAVNYGLNNLKSGDILVITGKGPEKFITIKDKKIPFNDSEAVKNWRDSK
ncbi:MAG: UDP-N-acetylmuramoyl-L-alanyl-D-glutamate--2,6-diaminopimelate ligase [Synergistaceae bacterium]|nr:UDP-N-acetylmuramoyl-L-alanyl-D-glutamate--2,6-diaminopimelate ligase [Synergistaceae bacterium]MBR0234667.1 UDP-N-acetylmuramoyl-L-alanyl-D-glutamate--2,6-diaminopimelate ligase [Synergistaceae bacterium]